LKISPESNKWLPQCNNSSADAEMGNHLAKSRRGLLCPFRGGAGSPSNTMWPGLRHTSITSGILIHPTVWPQHQRYRQTGQDRQRSDSIGRTVLQTVAQKPTNAKHTSSSAAAERPRKPLSQLKSCQLLHNCTKNHI